MNIFPSRSMDLPMELKPENAKKFGDLFCSAVKQNEGLELDYSIESLEFIDHFLGHFSEELGVDDFAETILSAGCYAGQVLVENAGGEWIKAEEARMRAGVNMMPILIRLPNGSVWDPIAKAFKRFANGEADNLTYFYTAATEVASN